MKRPNAAGDACAILAVRVTPRSRKLGVGGMRDGVLAIAVAAPPDRGRATEEAAKVIAGWLGIAPSRVTLAGGGTSRSKRFRVAGISASDLGKHVSALLADGPKRVG